MDLAEQLHVFRSLYASSRVDQIVQVCNCPIQFLDSVLTIVNYPFCKEFNPFESSFLKKHPGILSRDSW